MRSVSPEFECIDRIYEANVLAGNIKDTIGEFEDLVEKLKKEDEIIILGIDRMAQDAYDLLMSNGIGICCFAVSDRVENKRLLAKPVMSIEEAMQCHKKPIFINSMGTHGALGEKWTEYFDYRGYRRNHQYFLLSDYMDIPTSNLVHVLHGKAVVLTGDRRLCQILSDYLNKVENGKITIRYVEMTKKAEEKEEEILCAVFPDIKRETHAVTYEWKESIKKQLAQMDFNNYTEYFTSIRSFVLVDLYLHQNTDKYAVAQLKPKGILMCKSLMYCGSTFLRGIMDGHPEVVEMPDYGDLNDNLFYYCVRLADVPAEQVMSSFWELFNAERYCLMYNTIPEPRLFDAAAERLLKLKTSFTSQELFVLFHIAYAEMINGGQHIIDISRHVIYWEPHTMRKSEFHFIALWLEEKGINGNILITRRNNLNRVGSHCGRMDRTSPFGYPTVFEMMFLAEAYWDEDGKVECKYWKEHKMRFEDIKTRPKESLEELCEIMDISYTDSMMKTTKLGEPLSENGSLDFDLKPVFKQYEEYLSEFDRFRISIASSLYQKQYGYTYVNCLKFSRSELQELFLKPFLFEEKGLYSDIRTKDDVVFYEWMRWRLWKIHKHMVLKDIVPEFDQFQMGRTGAIYLQKQIERSLKYIRTHDKVIFYGIGNDCGHLLELLGNDVKNRLLYSDKRASSEVIFYEGKKVISLEKLCQSYNDYYIFVTASGFMEEIKEQFLTLGINPARVYYNKAGFGFK